MPSNQKPQKPIILALPGYNDTADKFFPLTKLLKNRYQLISLNYPYIKSSVKPFTLDDSVNFLKDFVKSRQLDQFILLGFSYGGYVATEYAHQCPEKITKLYFLNYSPKLIKRRFFRKLYSLLKPFLVTKTFIFFYSRLRTTPLRYLFTRHPLKYLEKE